MRKSSLSPGQAIWVAGEKNDAFQHAVIDNATAGNGDGIRDPTCADAALDARARVVAPTRVALMSF